jgi:hypothetical protein
MTARRLCLVRLALVVLGLAWSLPAARRAAGAGPAPGEATPVLLVQSLWHDRNLRFEERDLARAEQLWNGGPAGLALLTPDGGATFRYAVPLAYPLAALPAYALLGVRGLPLLNAALYLALLAAALLARSGRDPAPPFGAGAGLLLAGTFFASAALPAAFRHGPEVFVTAGLFLPLFAWQRWRDDPTPGRRVLLLLAAAGAWLAAAALPWEPAALLALPIAADLLLGRRRRALLAFGAGALLAATLLLALQARFCRSPFPAHAEARRTYSESFPVAGATQGPTTGSSEATRPPTCPTTRELARTVVELLAGRHGGLLPAFPFALFALGLFAAELRSSPRDRRLLAGALALAALGALLARPESPGPGPWLGLLAPTLLLLPRRWSTGRALLLPYAAAGLWTAGLVLAGLGAPAALLHTAPYRLLPAELTRLRDQPGLAAQIWGGAVWLMPAETFWTAEQHPRGVWMRGAATSEVIVVAPRPLSDLRLWAWSLAETNVLTLDDGNEQVTVRFDTPGKRGGTPLTLHPKPVARSLDFLPGAPNEVFYRLTLTTTAGAVPARRDPQSADRRYLGVFLDFTGRGP